MEVRGASPGLHGRPRLSRQSILKAAVWLTVFGVPMRLAQAQSEEEVPAEPEDLDEPTQWQEGDPEPVEMTIPAEEQEQTSQEAPPSQPMDDDRGTAPGDDYLWATGYWWWTNDTYVWVPGYWAASPQPGLVWASGYWRYTSPDWIYVRGEWRATTSRSPT